MIHAYTGTGKGKTTAAMGLALRAAGNGWRVFIVQFLKSGSSGETLLLSEMPNVSVRAGKGCAKFTFAMDDADRARARTVHDANLEAALDEAESLLSPLPPRVSGVMVVLDEALDALAAGLLDEALVRRALALSDANVEVVLTGRETPSFVDEAADYLTRMECVRHPYQKGLAARRGVEL